MAEVKVSDNEVKRIKKQIPKDNGIVDRIEELDRGTGGVMSSIGKFLTENW